MSGSDNAQQTHGLKPRVDCDPKATKDSDSLPLPVSSLGTPMAAVVLPRTLGELQLFRILQRANLLCYYEAFIQQGGDDVQQLCEAAEEEFLEIMALVGMATKPLHVRRLQKALRDWVTNPALFSQPLTSLPVCSIPIYRLPEGSPTSLKLPKATATACLEGGKDRTPAGSPLPGGSEGRFWASLGNDSDHSLSPTGASSPCSPRDGLEALDAAATQSVMECVERLAQSLPKSDPTELKEQLRGNKKLGKMIGHICDMSEDDSQREEEIRKYSAIYGRFDSKRRDGKQLTLHELTVNEAAAQLCMKDLALLTRRDELFNLARQVSREVTYKYTYRTSKSRCGDRDEPSPKRIKVEEGFFDLQEALQTIHIRQEMLKEQLASAKSKGEETLRHSLQVQLDHLLDRQMDILRDAAVQERLQALDWRIPPAALRYLNIRHCRNTASPDRVRELPVDRPLNLQMPGHKAANGDIPLGKQLANELKRHHKAQNALEGRTSTTENGFSEKGIRLMDEKTIKSEPEDSR